MNKQPPIRFSVYELDVPNAELRKQGVLVKIQNQPLQVLQVLLERAGELVTREELQTRIWSNDTFVDFDQSLNRAINKVREVLNDEAGSPRFIETVPRRGYRFIAAVEAGSLKPSHEQPEAVVAQTRKPRKTFPWVAVGVAAALATAAGLWLTREVASPKPRVVPLTTLTGHEIMPAFSPDGRQVAFVWNGENQKNQDIYVKVVGGEYPLRLTSDPAQDRFPAWSPTGKEIAFSRIDGKNRGMYLVSPLGGPERKLTDLVTLSRPSWSADGQHLLIAQAHSEAGTSPGDGALFLIPVGSGGEPRQVLAVPPGKWYRDPTYSPDRRSLAYLSCSGPLPGSTCTLQISGLKDELVPVGDPRPIQQYSNPFGLAWAEDSSSLIYCYNNGNAQYLWRVGVRDGKEAERLEVAGMFAWGPAIKAGRLAFSRTLQNTNIWRLQQAGKASLISSLSSTFADDGPQYSHDGERIAFSSGRGGEDISIWVAKADGTDLNQIAKIAGQRSGTPRWSPDGNWIAFDSHENGVGWDIWITEAGGGSLRRLTHGPADNVIPSWSHDGTSIYFASKRSGRFEIWRAPVSTGTAVQITRAGGLVAFESSDGKNVFYTKNDEGVEGVYARQLPDGDEKQIVSEPVAARSLALFDDGLYYLHLGKRNVFEIRYLNSSTGKVETLGEVAGAIENGSGLAVSPDRKTFLFSQLDGGASDLMLIENFR